MTKSWTSSEPRGQDGDRPAGAVTLSGRILGIDPGSRVTGFGLVSVQGPRVLHLGHGCIRPPAGASLAERLGMIFDQLCAVIGEHAPTEVAIERVFVSRNADSALKLGQARGAALVAAAGAALPVFEYTPTEVKQAVVGGGRAQKAQVQHMVCRLLGLGQTPAEDAADALGVALCRAHLRHAALQGMLAAGRSARRGRRR